MLTDSNVHETAPDEYDSGTTYGDGDFAHVINGISLDIYESLQDSNTANDPETETDYWRYRSSTYPEYAAGTTYSTGDRVIIAATHKVYESLQSSNTGNAPASSATYWIEVGSTNKWDPFDQKIGSQIERTGEITYEFQSGIVEGIAFFNLSAVSVDIVMTTTGEGEVYNETIDLVSTSSIIDWYTFFFVSFRYTKNAVRLDLPPYSGATITVSINAESDTTTAKCGEIVLGRVADCGITKYSPSYEIRDFSTKGTDDFGNFEIVERAFSKLISLSIMFSKSEFESLKDFFEDYRVTPVVWIVSPNITHLESPLSTYGFYDRLKIIVEYPTYCIGSLDLISLI